MNGENIRVLARVMLIGKSLSVNAVEVFSFFLRIVVLFVMFLYFKNFSDYRQSTIGKAVLVVGAVSVVAALILLECMRTVKDKWYAAAKRGENCSFSQLIVSFGLCDLSYSLAGAFMSYWASALRFIMFFFVPAISLIFSIRFLEYGVSNAMLTVLVAGNFLLFCCALLFWIAALNSVSLARSLCVGDIKRFTSVVYALDKYAFSLFGFGALLSVINRGSRRLAKIMYATAIFLKM